MTHSSFVILNMSQHQFTTFRNASFVWMQPSHVLDGFVSSGIYEFVMGCPKSYFKSPGVIRIDRSRETLLIYFVRFVLYIQMPFALQSSSRCVGIMDSNAIGDSRHNWSIRNEHRMCKPDRHCLSMSLRYIGMAVVSDSWSPNILRKEITVLLSQQANTVIISLQIKFTTFIRFRDLDSYVRSIIVNEHMTLWF
jgi:hypothetical protein